jgi:transposase-like protein
MLLLTPSVSGLFKWRQFEPEASCWRLAGTCVSYCRTVTWRSFLLSVDFWSTTSSSGGGSNVTSRKWNDVYARDSNGPATVGGWTLNYIRSWASGATCIVAVNSSGATIDFLNSAKQDAAAAERFLSKTLGRQHHPVPRVINTDGHSACPPAIVRFKAEGAFDEDCRHRPVPYLNNVVEQDHRAIKRRSIRVSISDRFGGAWRTIAGYEAVHMIRKGQACWSAVCAKVGLLYRFIVGMFGTEV